MNNRLICVVIAILPFHLAGVGGVLQHMCWHFGREHVPRKMELPIHHRNVSSTTHTAGCARQLFINRLTLCSSGTEVLSLILSCEPFLSCLEPAAAFSFYMFSLRMVLRLVFKLKKPRSFSDT